MGAYRNEIDFLTMKSMRENESYDVPWEFVRRRATGSSAGTNAAAPSTGTTSTGVGRRGSSNENDIFQQAASVERIVIGKRTNGRFSAGDGPVVNGCKKGNDSSNCDASKPPIVAPKPTITSDDICAKAANGGSSSASSTTCIFNKMPGDSMNSVIINTPPCGIRAQRIRKERYASGGCTPMGTVSASPALSRNASSVETTDELASCVVWEYRKPEHDVRPSCEYDVPWDCKRLSSGRETPSQPCPNSTATDVTRRSTDGDAIYDEPWDINKGGDPIKNAVLGLSLRSSAKRDSAGISSNNSPSSTSRSSDSRTSAAMASSNECDRLDDAGRSTSQAVRGQGLDVVSVNSAGSTLANGQEGRNGTKKANGGLRTPIRLETAFCAKPFQSAATVTESKKRFQDKDKLIQQLCSGDSAVSLVRQSGVRRSVNNTRHSTELQTKDRRTLDDKTRSDQPGTAASTSVGTDATRQQEAVRNAEIKDGNQTCAQDYDTPWEFSSSPETAKVVRELQNAQRAQQLQTGNAKKPEAKSKPNRQHLSLNFGCAGLNPTSAKIDTSLPLNEQLWYHGNITRAEAEQRLSKIVEGSFLVRVCESSLRQGEEYALSLKSAKGFMHMKIQQDAQRNWILGYFSQPFESVPVMIRYYSLNKLPIKGAEHMRLLHPVADQVL